MPANPQHTGSWNRNGTIIFGQVGRGVMRVPASGGPASVVISAAGEENALYPQFLPDGRHFLYGRSGSNPAKSDAYVGSLDAKPEER